MASISKILEEIFPKLDAQLNAILAFNANMRAFFNSFREENKSLTVVLDNFGTKANTFNARMRNLFKESLIIESSIKKISKKPSASLRDIASLTQRIENLTKRGEIFNAEAAILFEESKIIKEKYSMFAK